MALSEKSQEKEKKIFITKEGKRISHVPSDRKYYEHVLLSKRERRLFERWAQQNDIAYTEMLVFDALTAAPEGMEPAQISRRTLMYKQTLTRVLKNLLDKGYIQQRVHPDDHRKKIITMTEKGTDFIVNTEKTLTDAEWEAIGFLSDEELEHFNGTYHRIVNNLERLLFNSNDEEIPYLR